MTWRERLAQARRVSGGSAVAWVLATSWRVEPEVGGVSEDDLRAAEPLLLRAGAGGLGWWRARRTRCWESLPAIELRQAHRLHAMHAAIHERALARAFGLLREAGVEALLGKGWASARLYPEAGLRPFGDADLYVADEFYAAARAALAAPAGASCLVNLHRGCGELRDRSWPELARRARAVVLPGVRLRLFGPEDHLRLLALDVLRQGGWNPLGLCDLAAALESRPADFDWDYALSGDRRRTDRVACALVLARELLDASFAGVPPAVANRPLPRWLAPAILEAWGDARGPSVIPRLALAPRGRPRAQTESMRVRWPNAVEASVGVGAPFNEWPRLPFQVGEYLARAFRGAWALPRRLTASRPTVSAGLATS